MRQKLIGKQNGQGQGNHPADITRGSTGQYLWAAQSGTPGHCIRHAATRGF